MPVQDAFGVCVCVYRSALFPYYHLNIMAATRPLGSRPNVAQRHRSEYSKNTVQKGLCTHWPVGDGAGATTWQLSQSVRQRRSETTSTTRPPPEPLFRTVRSSQSVNNSKECFCKLWLKGTQGGTNPDLCFQPWSFYVSIHQQNHNFFLSLIQWISI